MDVSRLNRDELQYELKVRGYTDVRAETMLSMRRHLEDIVRDECFGQVVAAESFKPEVVDEIELCNRKVVDLESYLIDREIILPNSSESRFVDTKLWHLYGRLSRLKPTEDGLLTGIARLREQLSQIEADLDLKLNSAPKGALNVNTTPPPMLPNVSHAHTSTPVHKWNLLFSGDKGSMSVNAFIERVEELRVARGVSWTDLYSSIIDLLTGKALLWFRSMHNRITSWPDFVQQLRSEFLPLDYETDLWSEIRSRVQGPHERVGEFFACMLNLFNRLASPPTEEQKLIVLRRTIAPYFIHGLGLVEINTVEDLMSSCKKLETARETALRFKPNFQNSVNLLEPDLAYSMPSSSYGDQNNRDNFGNSSRLRQINSIQCWNCQQSGHSFTRCSQPRNNTFCFRCGKNGVTKYQCTCNPKNEGTSRRLAGRRP